MYSIIREVYNIILPQTTKLVLDSALARDPPTPRWLVKLVGFAGQDPPTPWIEHWPGRQRNAPLAVNGFEH